MEHTFFSATLGLYHPWEILDISLSKKEKRMDISICAAPDSSFVCPTCGKSGIICEEANEVWRHDDFFQYAAYLHVRVPLITCCCCGVCTMERPWTRIGSRFVLVSENTSSDNSRHERISDESSR